MVRDIEKPLVKNDDVLVRMQQTAGQNIALVAGSTCETVSVCRSTINETTGTGGSM